MGEHIAQDWLPQICHYLMKKLLKYKIRKKRKKKRVKLEEGPKKETFVSLHRCKDKS